MLQRNKPLVIVIGAVLAIAMSTLPANSKTSQYNHQVTEESEQTFLNKENNTSDTQNENETPQCTEDEVREVLSSDGTEECCPYLLKEWDGLSVRDIKAWVLRLFGQADDDWKIPQCGV